MKPYCVKFQMKVIEQYVQVVFGFDSAIIAFSCFQLEQSGESGVQQ